MELSMVGEKVDLMAATMVDKMDHSMVVTKDEKLV
jgi:hypothetical protein